MKYAVVDDLDIPVKQPKRGWKHPRHMIAFRTKQLNLKYAMGALWEDNTICLSPSSKAYQEAKSKVSFVIEDYDPTTDPHYVRKEVT